MQQRRTYRGHDVRRLSGGQRRRRRLREPLRTGARRQERNGVGRVQDRRGRRRYTADRGRRRGRLSGVLCRAGQPQGVDPRQSRSDRRIQSAPSPQR